MNNILAQLLLMFLCVSVTTQAQWSQVGQDIDGEATIDASGRAVSINSDGSIVAIGAYKNDGNGEDSGQVRIFKNINEVWVQIGEDIDGEEEDDLFGRSISLSSNGLIVAIGADKSDANGFNSGQVRVFENVNEVWVQKGQSINGEEAVDFSGRSVNLSSDGSIVAIGAVNNDGNGSRSGHVRVFEFFNETWTQIGEDIDGEVADDFSGWSVSLSANGGIVAIGAIGNDEFGNQSGHVRVFENLNGVWTQIGEDIDGEIIHNHFGSSVSLSSDGMIIAIGASGTGDGTIYCLVRLFENINGSWIQVGENIIGEDPYDRFGHSVSLSSDGLIVAIGAYGYNNSSGHVKVFENINNDWIQIGESINGEFQGDASGWSVSLNSDGSIVAIGAPSNNNDNGAASGHVRIFEYELLGVFETNNLGFSVYPNPTYGVFNIEFSNNDFIQIRIYDITGKLIYNGQHKGVNNISNIDISNFENGIYLIKVQKGFQIYTAKVIKN